MARYSLDMTEQINKDLCDLRAYLLKHAIISFITEDQLYLIILNPGSTRRTGFFFRENTEHQLICITVCPDMDNLDVRSHTISSPENLIPLALERSGVSEAYLSYGHFLTTQEENENRGKEFISLPTDVNDSFKFKAWALHNFPNR